MDESMYRDVAAMAGPTRVVSETPEPRLFSFGWLENRIEELTSNADEPVVTRLEWCALVVAVIIGVLSMKAGVYEKVDNLFSFPLVRICAKRVLCLY
jgi:hypothetical protein